MLRQLIFVAALFGVGLAFSELDAAAAFECDRELKGIIQPDRRFLCMSKCIGLKLGVISEDGIINEPRFQQLYNVSAEKLKADMAKCRDETGEDACYKVGYKYLCVMFKLNQ